MRPQDLSRPLVCLDECSKQLTAETRDLLPMQPGQPARYDYEYQRNGTSNLFMLFAPLEGWRHVKVTKRRTSIDYAHVLKDLADIHFAKAERIILVHPFSECKHSPVGQRDNLNTHKPASLYKAFPPAEARRLVERFEWHYTPKHGSWLNMAESELAVLSTQCLSRRIPNDETLRREVTAWQAHRNQSNASADWQFKSEDARIKLKSLYPVI